MKNSLNQDINDVFNIKENSTYSNLNSHRPSRDFTFASRRQIFDKSNFQSSNRNSNETLLRKSMLNKPESENSNVNLPG